MSDKLPIVANVNAHCSPDSSYNRKELRPADCRLEWKFYYKTISEIECFHQAKSFLVGVFMDSFVFSLADCAHL